MTPETNHRACWSDEKLEVFYGEFREHIKAEVKEGRQQEEIYEALFRTEDKAKNVGPGVIQLLTQVADRIETMEIAADRQKRFLGGVMFAFSCVGFFFTDTAHKLMAWIKSV